jgi:3',5'-cyclic AMP phosphodiesterase CpdA
MYYNDPFERESSEEPAAPLPSPDDAGGQDAGSADAPAPIAGAPDDIGAAGIPADATPAIPSVPASPAEPPIWSTSDNHVLHLPPAAVERIILAIPWLRRLLRPPARPAAVPPVRPPARRPRRQAIRAVGQIVRRARRVGTRAGTMPVFRAAAGGRNFRIVARPRAGLRNEIVSIEPELGGVEGELEQKPPQKPQSGPAKIQARILWPALGFPAVVTPNVRPSKETMRDGDATRCVCVLVLSDHADLKSAHAAEHLRYVSWDKRGRRHIRNNPAASFPTSEISVVRRTPVAGRKDSFGQHVKFGHNGNNQHGITALLADYVTRFYERPGLKHLYEIRISEAATAKLGQGQYQLFWNNELTNESLPSDEMFMLLAQFARPRRKKTDKEQDLDFLVKEYRYEYGGIHPPYNQRQGAAKPVAAEILHPLFVQRHREAALRIGHITDTHVDVRADVYESNLIAAGKRAFAERTRLKAQGKTVDDLTNTLADRKDGYNNFNRSFEAAYAKVKDVSDILLMTGDLIDYGRGFWGVGKPSEVQVDALYHSDRNWFLFYYLLASSGNYSKPAYTILGNHDWRLNPYPPFAPGAPNPDELLHGHLQDIAMPAGKTSQERKKKFDALLKGIIAAAHGPGHARGFSYTTKAESTWQLLGSQGLASSAAVLIKLFAQTTNVEQKGFPIETSVESIAWYLLSINPFLDYAFTLPGKQSVLMLDWAKDEDVLFSKIENGDKTGYNPLMPGDAAGTPRPRNNLTQQQQNLVSDFLSGPSRAKVIGIHAPVLSPYADWYDSDLMISKKTYPDPAKARGPKAGHPIFAATPSTVSGMPSGIVADRGSLGRTAARDWFVKLLANPKYSVRMVLSGHVHRNLLLVNYTPTQKIELTNPKDSFRNRVITGALVVRRVVEQAIKGAKPPAVVIDASPEKRQGPLYILTTSAGPRGSFEERPLSPTEDERGKSTDPGYARAELTSDGTITSVMFGKIAVPKTAKAAVPVVRPVPTPTRELDEVLAGTW